MTDQLSPQERRAVLAAEFALGLLDQGGQAEALRLLETDRHFAAEVARWDAEIDSWLTEDSGDVGPSEVMWQRIAAGIGSPVKSPTPAMPARHTSAGWRITALAASLAAVIFASLWLGAERPIVVVPQTPAKAVALDGLSVAQIPGDGEQRLVTAVYERATGRLLARLSPLDSRDGVPALWLIGSDGKPRSLGVARSGEAISITLPPEVRDLFAEGATIAISIEPTAETHDSPAGPILGTAKISAM